MTTPALTNGAGLCLPDGTGAARNPGDVDMNHFGRTLDRV